MVIDFGHTIVTEVGFAGVMKSICAWCAQLRTTKCCWEVFVIECGSSCCPRITFLCVFISGDRNRRPGHSAEPAATVCAALGLPAAAQQTLLHHPQQAAQAGPH